MTQSGSEDHGINLSPASFLPWGCPKEANAQTSASQMLGSMGGNYREFETKGKGLSLDTRVSFEGRALAKPHFGEAEGSQAGEEEPALLKVSGAEVVLPCSPLGAFG